jgi:hypothetical protein
MFADVSEQITVEKSLSLAIVLTKYCRNCLLALTCVSTRPQEQLNGFSLNLVLESCIKIIFNFG